MERGVRVGALCGTPLVLATAGDRAASDTASGIPHNWRDLHFAGLSLLCGPQLVFLVLRGEEAWLLRPRRVPVLGTCVRLLERGEARGCYQGRILLAPRCIRVP